MLNSGAFFRRNRMLLWFGIAVFMAIFVSIQLGKAVSRADSHYGDIAECSYTHEAPELQTPASQQLREESICLSNETRYNGELRQAGS